MNFAFFDSISASSTLSDTWNVYSVVEPVFTFFSFVWFTGFLCCLRKTHEVKTSYGSPSKSISFFGNTSLYDNIPSILFKIPVLSRPFALILQNLYERVLFLFERTEPLFFKKVGVACNAEKFIDGIFFRLGSACPYQLFRDPFVLKSLPSREAPSPRKPF